MVPPDACPSCGFVWGAYQGHRHGYGYIALGARVWECTRCRHVLRTPDPSFRSVV